MSDTQLHDWLAYRDELSRRATVPDRVVRNVEAQTLERPVRGMGRGRLLLVVAAVAALLFAGIGLPHVLLRSQPGGTYAPAGAPAGVPNRRPPAGVALVWVPDPASPNNRIIALDHAGHPMGWLPLQGPLGEGQVEQSADGQRLVLTDYDHASMMEVTAQGERIGLPPTSRRTGPNTFEAWNLFFSDDGRSLCLEQGERGTPHNLVIVGSSGHVVHSFPEAPVDNPSYLSWHVVTCSVRNDVAVLIGQADPQTVPVPTATPQPTSHGGLGVVSGPSVQFRRVPVPKGAPNYVVRVVRLSTGAELARRVYDPSRPEPFDASEDGTLVLERNASLNSYTVRNIVTGAVAGTLATDARGLLGNHLAIVQGPFTVTVPPSPVTHLLVDFTTGRTVWSETLPIPSTGMVSYIGDGSVVVGTEQHGGPQCPAAWATVEIADLDAGTIHTVRLDTCPTR